MKDSTLPNPSSRECVGDQQQVKTSKWHLSESAIKIAPISTMCDQNRTYLKVRSKSHISESAIEIALNRTYLKVRSKSHLSESAIKIAVNCTYLKVRSKSHLTLNHQLNWGCGLGIFLAHPQNSPTCYVSIGYTCTKVYLFHWWKWATASN